MVMKLNEKTGLYENYGLWHVPFWQTDSFQLGLKIAACVIALLVLALLIRKYLQYCKRKKLPVWDQALADIRQLKNDQKVSAEYGKEFYLAISALLKKYLHERFGYDVLGKTDAESITYLREHHADDQLVAELTTLLQGGTVIKFANGQAIQEQLEHDYVRAIAIIQRTIPEEK